VVPPAQSRISKIVESLKKCSINRPDDTTLQRLSRDEKLLDFGCINTDCALDIYRSVKESASTQTKSFIGKSLNLFINGPIFDGSPRIFSAHDDTLKW
jgi:hypothetical protein